MRLSLALFLLTCPLGATVYTACSSGCDASSFATGLVVADGLSNCLSITGNLSGKGDIGTPAAPGTITMSDGVTLDTSQSGDLIGTDVGLTHYVKVLGGVYTNTHGGNIGEWLVASASATMDYEGVTFVLPVGVANNAYQASVSLQAVHQLVLNRCVFIDLGSTNDVGVYIDTTAQTKGLLVTNCLFYGLTNSGIAFYNGAAATTIAEAYNNTIVHCATGFIANRGCSFSNNLLLDNTTDISIGGDASTAMLSYNGYGQLASGGGTGSVYGLTDGNAFGLLYPFYWILNTASVYHAGVNIPGVTGLAGLNGVIQALSIGANEYTGIPGFVAPFNLGMGQ